MSIGAQAYARTARTTASPRDIEAQALLKAARKLQEVMANWATTDEGLDDALMFNRKLWSIFLTSATSNDNPLPSDVRQNIANLGLFVMNQTVSVMFSPKPESLRPLISINRELAAGLRTIR